MLKESNTITSYRTLSSILAISSLVYIFLKGLSVYTVFILIISIVTFLYFLYEHNKVKSELVRTRCKININNKYISRIRGSWINFKYDGQEFVDKNNSYTSDLDIFGKNSLFQFINETNTHLGKNTLRDILNPIEKNENEIYKRQDAVKEISEMWEFCENFKCEGMISKGVSLDPKDLFEFSEGVDRIIKYKWIRYIFIIISILILYFGISLFINPKQHNLILFIFLIMLSLSLNLLYFKRLFLILNKVSQFSQSIHRFKSMLTLIEESDFKSELNIKMQKKLFGDICSSKYIKKMGNISQAVDARNNSLIYIILLILLWDFHCVFALENLRDKGGKNIRRWLEVIGYFESIISISVLPQIYKSWAYPKFNTKSLSIQAVSLGHPLINSNERVYNDFNLNGIVIISGSNMSGKTTFLRTVGINLSLAYAGAPVCASSFTTPILDIYTSMRIQDDLKENISTFYAELLRIKNMVDNSYKRKPTIFLIDEIFRGTNSYDRIYGARQVLLQLNKPWVIGGISTHDLELCNLDKGNSRFKNYHFVEAYEGSKIKFDYKIKEGVSTTRNARFLMKIVGIELNE